MNRDEAREEIRRRATEYLQRDKRGKGYICPVCQSGTGSKGTGVTTKDGVHFTCWAGCFSNSDIIDVIGKEYGLDGYNDKLERAAAIFNITIERGITIGKGSRATAAAAFGGSSSQSNAKKNSDSSEGAATMNTTGAFTDFFIQAHNDIDKTDYWKRRGLSREAVERFRLGYVESWRHPKAPNAPASPRLIIPVTKYSYTARDTREQIPAEQEDYKKSKVKAIDGAGWIFNRRALKEAQQPIFIVEGELDAISITEVGGEAVGLGSIAYIRGFLEAVEKDKPRQPFIIALDNEKEPEKQERINKAAAELESGLKGKGFTSYRINPVPPQYKDANEALQKDKAALKVGVTAAYGYIQQQAEEELEAQRAEYIKSSAAYHLQGFINGIADSANTPYIPTGFSNLDIVLDGGLYEGLYILGAISSLGKTSLILQIADQIAESGTDILYFSLEMARSELMAKSISRLTFIDTLNRGIEQKNAKTNRGITTGSRYKYYNDTEKELIQRAINTYGQFAEHIIINEGIGDIGAEQIKAAVQKHILITGRKPVVIVDYLQILAPADVRASDKQNTDKAVLELKRISRDYKLPVLAISSFNRENYSKPVGMEAFKESGAIEYGSDVLFGLQLKGAGDKGFDVDEAKAKKPREIELIVLKNRNGETGVKVYFDYYQLFNYFEDTEIYRRSED